MNSIVRLAAFALVALAGCSTPYRWGATVDSEWSGRIGSARFADAVSTLGQPRQQISLATGDTKARWLARSIAINPEPGSMQSGSEERLLWRDMLFTKEGVLIRAWLSDQRDLADSEAP
jgi:hypothetical protein